MTIIYHFCCTCSTRDELMKKMFISIALCSVSNQTKALYLYSGFVKLQIDCWTLLPMLFTEPKTGECLYCNNALPEKQCLHQLLLQFVPTGSPGISLMIVICTNIHHQNICTFKNTALELQCSNMYVYTVSMVAEKQLVLLVIIINCLPETGYSALTILTACANKT